MPLNNFKIACTGDPNKLTIANGISKVFDDVDFIHRSVGYDLLTSTGLSRFEDTIKNYNVFINASRIDIGVQIKLLEITNKVWSSGHVFNIGSVLEYNYFNYLDEEVAKDKQHLKKIGLEMLNDLFRTTHVTVGGLKNTNEETSLKMDPVHVATTIKWILDSNKHFHIPVIGIENDFWDNENWNKVKQDGLHRKF